MKKFGFTLAEVLIALGIIGVVAAVTIPSFTANTQNQANASRLSATVSTLENAFSAIIAGEGYDDLDEPNLYGNYLNPDILNKYIKGGSGFDNAHLRDNLYSANNPLKTISGGAPNVLVGAQYYALKSGAVLFECSVDDDTGCAVAIDVNGADGPNRFGRDVFFFDLNNNGTLTPVGGNGAWRNNCSDNNKGNGSACTGRLVENNYKVDY